MRQFVLKGTFSVVILNYQEELFFLDVTFVLEKLQLGFQFSGLSPSSPQAAVGTYKMHGDPVVLNEIGQGNKQRQLNVGASRG